MIKRKIMYIMFCFLFLTSYHLDLSFAESNEKEAFTQVSGQKKGNWENIPIELNNEGTLTLYINQENLELPSSLITDNDTKNEKSKELVLDEASEIKASDVRKIKFVGEIGQLYLPEDARYLFASQLPNGTIAFQNLAEIEGLDVLNSSRTKKIAHLFDNLKFLEHLIFPADFSVKEISDWPEMISGLKNLKTLILPETLPVDNFLLFAVEFKTMSKLETLKLPDNIKKKFSDKEIASCFTATTNLKNLLVGEALQSLVISESKKQPLTLKKESLKESGTYWGEVPIQMAGGVLVIQSPRDNDSAYYLKPPNSDGTLDNKHSIKASDVTTIIFSNTNDKVKLPEDASYLFATKYNEQSWFEKLAMVIDFDRLDTSSAKNMTGLFSGQERLTSLSLSRMKTPNTLYMDNMFKGMKSLEEIHLPETFETEQVISMNGMFSDMLNLKSLKLPNSFKVTPHLKMLDLFKGVTNLELLEFGDQFYFNTGTASSLPALPINEEFTGGWKSTTHRFKSSDEMMKRVKQSGFGGTYYREEVEQGLKIPDRLIFKNGISGVYKSQLLGRKDENWKMTVFDNSPGVKNWHIGVRLKEPFTAETIENRSAENILVYKKRKTADQQS